MNTPSSDAVGRFPVAFDVDAKPGGRINREEKRMLIFEIESGEMIESIEAQAKSAGVRHAAIVSLIGGVDSFTVHTMSVSDATKNIVSDYDMPGEMHGSGEIVDGKAHIHATFAVQGDRAVAGHVHGAVIGTWFARAYVVPVA